MFGDLGRIRVPTLILHGVHDMICPFALGEMQHKGIRTSTLVPFEESGHGLFWEQREKFNSSLQALPAAECALRSLLGRRRA